MTRTIPPDDAIDPAVRALVAALNAMDSVTTWCSCGGHKDPVDCQVPSDEFFVNFTVRPDASGWADLRCVGRAVARVDRQTPSPLEGVSAVEARLLSGPPFADADARLLAFQLTGRFGADADQLASYLL